MPYITQIPAAVISVQAGVQVVDLPSTQLVNAFGSSVEFQQYDIAATSATTLVQGDALVAVDQNGAPVVSGSYLGSGTLSNAAIQLNVGLASLSLQVDPIAGQYMLGGDGKVYLITDQPLDSDHLMVTATATVLGSPTTVNAPMSQIVDQLASAVGGVTGSLIGAATNTIQSALNAAIITLDFDPNGTLPLDDGQIVPCFTRGTLILTAVGLVPVEDLSPGDLVRTRDNGLQPIRWCGSVRLGANALARMPRLRPIRFRAGALGQGQPTRDLVVSPQHRLLVRSRIAQRMFGSIEVLVAAKQLLDLPGVATEDQATEVEYIHLMFDSHEIIQANGAETESLYAGPMALRAISPAARAEIYCLFPELMVADYQKPPARMMPTGQQARQLAQRHGASGKALVTQGPLAP